jgi:hypothetical protein
VDAQAGPNEEATLHLVRGAILKARGDLAGAAVEFRKELDRQPGNREIEKQLASTQR